MSYKNGQSICTLNGVKIVAVDIANIYINPRYQRNQPDKRVDFLVSNFDWQLCGCLKVVKAGANRWEAVDAGTRLRAVKRQFPKGKMVLCELLDKNGAEAFLGLNAHHPPNKRQKFRAHYDMKTPWAVGTFEAVKVAGFKPRMDRGTPGIGELANLDALGTIYQEQGDSHLAQVLKIVKMFKAPRGEVESKAKSSTHMQAISKALTITNYTEVVKVIKARNWTAAEYRDGCTPYLTGSSSVSYINAIAVVLTDAKA